MAIGSGHMTAGWLGCLQCVATWHQGGCDGNRAWPHGTREAGMATGSVHMAPGWVCKATVPCHMALGWLG